MPRWSVRTSNTFSIGAVVVFVRVNSTMAMILASAATRLIGRAFRSSQQGHVETGRDDVDRAEGYGRIEGRDCEIDERPERRPQGVGDGTVRGALVDVFDTAT